jgi:hypothetical protein
MFHKNKSYLEKPQDAQLMKFELRVRDDGQNDGKRDVSRVG